MISVTLTLKSFRKSDVNRSFIIAMFVLSRLLSLNGRSRSHVHYKIISLIQNVNICVFLPNILKYFKHEAGGTKYF